MKRCAAALLALAAVACDDDAAAPPAPEARDCRLHVRFEARGLPAAIGVAGSWNDYDASAAPLIRDADGAWTGAFDVPPGRHVYRFEVDGRPFVDEANPLTVWRDGMEQSAFDAPDCSVGALVDPQVVIDGDRADITLRIAAGRAGLPGGSSEISARVGERPAAVRLDGDRLHITATGLPRGKHRLMVEGAGLEQLDAPFWVEETPWDWRDAIIYQVVVDRFAGAGGAVSASGGPAARGLRHGGDLTGVLEVLESGYIESLGANTLWLSPLYVNPVGRFEGREGGAARYEGYHGYWPVDPRAVEPAFGDEAIVERLVEAAHARGMRVLVDVVLNHVHETHVYQADHPDWFDRDGCVCGAPGCPWFSHIETCWFTEYLPDVRWDAPGALERQIDDALWWIERFDLDGLRVDAVPMMPRLVTRHLTAEMHRRFEGLGVRHYLLGETFTGPDQQDIIRWYLGPYGLDGQFDFPLMWALREVFAWESAPVWRLDDVWRESQDAWRYSTAVMGTMIGNHDVTRFLSEAAGDAGGDPFVNAPTSPDNTEPYLRQLRGQAFVLTAGGAPILYYGDEYGMPGASDPDNRRPMRFEDARTGNERWLAERVARLGRLRRCLPALRRGRMEILQASADRIVFLRDAGDGAPAWIVIDRRGGAPPTLPVPADTAVAADTLVDALSGARAERGSMGYGPAEASPERPMVFLPEGHPCLEIR